MVDLVHVHGILQTNDTKHAAFELQKTVILEDE
jgi:hypothetical protein